MSKKEAILRYSLIINRLRLKDSSFKEIDDYLEQESINQGYNFCISERTFDRDRKDILAIYNIEIKYDFSSKVYYIAQEDNNGVHNRLLEAFDTFNALNLSDKISKGIHFETRKSIGTENLHGMVHSIQNQLIIQFDYHKFYNNQITHRTVNPLALKEYKNRWYIMAKDHKDDHIKSFGLDRIKNLQITKSKYENDTSFDIDDHFKYSFGIISPNADKPEDIILSFTPFQGKYIQSMPLHHTQDSIIDNNEEYRIKLKLYITHDFIMEILSMGNNVKVIQPQSLIDEIKKVSKATCEQYL
ncbi:helix-turn-helix transcriptional regulator [Plebeiibacterium sediminum]|uniref:WYL domain-containing protein n=1 Tax=Plebeiibacterium sediminum TaxID=2992112 RepID=A0AAE3M4B4_9BACT|nr:WYL domain-containing protein [Plebeiobacterium sediminum]MCW3786854.1 WYL domain-containing protein [Plebeiobacterium sediminum]